MHLTFHYNQQKEYENFRLAFGSLNHHEPSQRQQQYLATYGTLTSKGAASFSRQYFADRSIDPRQYLRDVGKRWKQIELEFFRRADKIFRITLNHGPAHAYLTALDRCAYNYERKYFFIHDNSKSVIKTIMHELWHWYYFATVGPDILERFGKQRSNDIKEALTVMLNECFSDLMPGIRDMGYPQHELIRKQIVTSYKQTGDIYETIRSSLKT